MWKVMEKMSGNKLTYCFKNFTKYTKLVWRKEENMFIYLYRNLQYVLVYFWKLCIILNEFFKIKDFFKIEFCQILFEPFGLLLAQVKRLLVWYPDVNGSKLCTG